MDRQSHYYRQVQLLLRIIPFFAQHDCSALKGGTAINLFVRDFPQSDLEATREQLVRLINTSLTPQERAFLLSFKNRTPDWALLELSGIDQLPAVRWKLQNLAKMAPDKHADAYLRLKEILMN